MVRRSFQFFGPTRSVAPGNSRMLPYRNLPGDVTMPYYVLKRV